MNYYIDIIFEEAVKSFNNQDIPVGALILKDNKIISVAHNEKEILNISTKHAEILAIERACKKLNTWRLDECVLMTTMEPCMMCCGAILQARIKKVIYGVENIKFGYSKLLSDKYKVECIKYDDARIVMLLKEFFEKRR